jgi:hypothetical protein
MPGSEDTKRTSNVNLGDVARRLETQAQKLQFGVLSAIDFAFERFKDAHPELAMDGTLGKVKDEMIVKATMQAVNAIRGQSRIIRGVDRGDLTITK